MPRTVTRRRSTCSKRIRPCAQVCARCLGTRPFPALPSRAPAAQNVCNYLLFAFTFCHNFFSVSRTTNEAGRHKRSLHHTVEARSSGDKIPPPKQLTPPHHTTPHHTAPQLRCVYTRRRWHVLLSMSPCLLAVNAQQRRRTSSNVVERRRTSSNVVERRRTSSNVVERRRTTTKKTQSSWRRSESFVVLRFLISLRTVWLHTTYTKSH